MSVAALGGFLSPVSSLSKPINTFVGSEEVLWNSRPSR